MKSTKKSAAELAKDVSVKTCKIQEAIYKIKNERKFIVSDKEYLAMTSIDEALEALMKKLSIN